MPYQLIVENENGEQLELTNNRNFDILDVSGTNPPVASINTVDVAGFDGSRFNSSRVQQRNIVLVLNIHHPIEANRLMLYSFFKTKRKVRLYYKNSHRNVYIDGYVESFENNPWTQLQQPQISIICPNPFWQELADTFIRFSDSIPLFSFPFSIPSSGIPFSELQQATELSVDVGEIETGGIIQFYATADHVVNPVFYNTTTNQQFGVAVDMMQNDLLTINTNQGEKSVTLLHNGVKTNLLADRLPGSEWITFKPGVNVLSYDASALLTNLDCSLTIRRKFEGV